MAVRSLGKPTRPWSPIPQPDGSLLIPLTRGLFARIDAADLPLVAGRAWNAYRRRDRGGFYAQTTLRLTPGRKGQKTVIYMHRLIAGAAPETLVDHRFGDTLDNRRQSLRVTDSRGNATNITSSKNQKAGGFKGVSWNRHAGKWEAGICAGDVKPCGRRRRMYIGLFVDPKDAARAYDAAALVHFGEFACLNFPANDAAGLVVGGVP